MTLTHEQKTAWERDGVLIIPGFYSEAQADLLLASLQRAWAERPHVTVDDLKLNLRMKLGHVSPQQRQDHIFKVNDLYLEFEEVRSVSLDPRMVDVLTELLGHKPVLCTTLSLERSTQQDNHIDSLYMTPITPGHLIATWIALEDVSPEAGPLRFVPGSHTLPLYTFADGSHHASNRRAPSRNRSHRRRNREARFAAAVLLPQKRRRSDLAREPRARRRAHQRQDAHPQEHGEPFLL